MFVFPNIKENETMQLSSDWEYLFCLGQIPNCFWKMLKKLCNNCFFSNERHSTRPRTRLLCHRGVKYDIKNLANRPFSIQVLHIDIAINYQVNIFKCLRKSGNKLLQRNWRNYGWTSVHVKFMEICFYSAFTSTWLVE